MRTLRAWLPICLLLAACALPGCVRLRFSNPDRTVWHAMPELADPPAEELPPRYAIVVGSFARSYDGAEPARDPIASTMVSRLLRRTGAFRDVYGPDSTRELPTSGAHIRIEEHFESNAHTGTNFIKALFPGWFGYRIDMSGKLLCVLTLPPIGRQIVYEEFTSATRYYYASGRTDSARRLLVHEIQETNLEALLFRMRADPRLRTGEPL